MERTLHLHQEHTPTNQKPKSLTSPGVCRVKEKVKEFIREALGRCSLKRRSIGITREALTRKGLGKRSGGWLLARWAFELMYYNYENIQETRSVELNLQECNMFWNSLAILFDKHNLSKLDRPSLCISFLNALRLCTWLIKDRQTSTTIISMEYTLTWRIICQGHLGTDQFHNAKFLLSFKSPPFLLFMYKWNIRSSNVPKNSCSSKKRRWGMESSSFLISIWVWRGSRWNCRSKAHLKDDVGEAREAPLDNLHHQRTQLEFRPIASSLSLNLSLISMS